MENVSNSEKPKEPKGKAAQSSDEQSSPYWSNHADPANLMKAWANLELELLKGGAHRELIDRAVKVFGSEEKAADWLTSPCRALQDQVPTQLIKRGDVKDIEIELGRIEHGIYV